MSARDASSAARLAQALGALLDAERDSIGLLAEHLDRTRESLTQGHDSHLETYLEFEVELLHKLEELHTRQVHLLREHGFPGDRDGLGQAFAWCDNDGRLHSCWQRIRESLQRCQLENRINARIARQSQDYAREALAVLRGDPAPGQRNSGYARDGSEVQASGVRSIGRA